MRNPTPTPFKRLIVRAVLNDVSPSGARVFSIPDDVEIIELHDVFLSMLGWQHDLGVIPGAWSGVQQWVILNKRGKSFTENMGKT